MFEDDEEEIYESIYENGHWVWDTVEEALKFISDQPSTEDDFGERSSICLKDIEFKDDIDLWEQQKFRKRIQRKTTDTDVVKIQENNKENSTRRNIKPPRSILSPAVINMLHLPTFERFLRALILCCQYYLQISEVMGNRTIELETKIQTKNSVQIESKYRDNLEDLRLLVAKEYCTIILGEGELDKYHHMGLKKMTSLTKKDALFFETIMRISIQMIWISLGRKNYNQIELEVNRILKSDIYNSVEHRLNTNYKTKINERERGVLFGHCVNQGKKVNTNSPLLNEVWCHRHIDYRLFGLGAVEYSGLSSRLMLLETVLSEPEEKFKDAGVSLGIIGLSRSLFDIMLKELRFTGTGGSVSSASIRLSASRSSRVMFRKSTISAIPKKLYPDIYLPKKEESMEILTDFCDMPRPPLQRHEEQRLKWINRISARKAVKKVKLIKNIQ